MSTLIGRVGMVMKGAWDSSVAYDTLDGVYYTDNSTYVAKQPVPAGTLPTNTTYWQLALDASTLQPKTMSSPVTIGGESKTTVEAAVGALENVKADKTAISSVETTSTAVSAHAVGSYFINASGQFVKATSAIAVGDTISGSNTAVSSVEEAKASKSDLTSIIATGSTNTTGATITRNTYFYLNGVLVKAKADIASGATFTRGTNYDVSNIGDDIKFTRSVTETYAIYRIGKMRIVTFENRTTNDGILAALSNDDIPARTFLNNSVVIDGSKVYPGLLVATSTGKIYGQYYIPNTTTKSDVNTTMQTTGEIVYFVE